MKINRNPGLIWTICLAALILALLLPLAGCTSAPSPAPSAAKENTSQNITLKFSGWLPAGDSQETVPDWYAGELNKRTNGKVKLEVYHGEMLGKQADFPEMLKGKVADIANINRTQPEFLDSVWQVVNMPFVAPEDMMVTEQAFYLAMHRGWFDSFLKDYKVMWLQPTPAQYLFLHNKKVVSAADFKGLKISGVSGVWVAIPERLGATGVAVPGTEAYMSLDRGVVDARISMPDFVINQKLNEVAHYVPWYSISGAGSFIIAMTKDRWNSLPVDVQLVMNQLNEEAQYQWLNKYYTTSAQFRVLLQKAGMEVYDLSDAEKARWKTEMKALTTEQMQKYAAKGLPAKELFDLYSSLREGSQ
jgi:TRAP-type transport system periplasmic protein